MQRIHLLFFLLAIPSLCNGQSLTNIVPPTPNAMKITEFFAQQPNMYTGTANVTIPLYSIDFDGWSLPLNLSYNATGVRTNEEASEVGLGWALSATGIVSRTIRGRDDLFEGSSTDGRYGYCYNKMELTFDLGYYYNDFTVPVTPIYPPTDSYYYHLAVNAPDTEPDIFSFNFFGYSGSFILTQKNFTSGNKILVKHVTKDATQIALDEASKSFIITTPEGFKGEFLVKERSTSFSGSTATNNRMNCCGQNLLDIEQMKNTSGRFRTVTSWYLSKITSPRGDVITFTYDLDANGDSQYISNTRTFAELEDVLSLETCIQTVHEHVYLKSIFYDGVLKIDFLMEDREDLRKNELFTSSGPFPPSKNLKRFKEIQLIGLGQGSSLNKRIKFSQTYFNQQYHRLSVNDENELQWLRGRLDEVAIDDQVYRFFYERGSKGIPNKLTNGIDHFGFYNGRDQTQRLLPPIPSPAPGSFGNCYPNDNNVVYYEQNPDRWVDFEYGKAGLLYKVVYPTKGYTLYEFESHSYLPSNYLFPTEGSTAPTQLLFQEKSGLKTAGGARVRKIQDYDYHGVVAKTKTYYYVENSSLSFPYPAELATTGRLMTPLLNRYKRPLRSPNTSDLGRINNCIYLYRTHSAIPGSNSAEGKLIGYSKVDEFIEAGTERYKNAYYFSNTPSKMLAGNALADGQDHLNGQVKEIRRYNSDGKLVQQVVNVRRNVVVDSVKALSYEWWPPSLTLPYIAPYYVRLAFNAPDVTITTTAITPSEAQEVGGEQISWGPKMVTTTSMAYNNRYLLSRQAVSNSFGDSLVTWYKRATDYSGTSATRDFMINANSTLSQLSN